MLSEPRMTLQMLKVLEVLLADAPAEVHGYEIGVRTGLKSGTLYPILARLESWGLAQSSWEQASPAELHRPRRRVYRLTHSGVGLATTSLEQAPGREVPATRSA